MDAVGTVGGVLLSKAASLVGARWGERRKAREAARGRLRSVVAHVQAQLDTADAFHVMAQRRLDVDAAIGELRALLGDRARARFDVAIADYSVARDAVQPAFLVFLESQAIGRPIDQSARARLVEALRALLAAAK